MQTVLITGFEPFGGEQVNPSWEAVKLLQAWSPAGVKIMVRQLPCVFGKAIQEMTAAIDTYQPTLVIAVGQAGGRCDITLERIAINIDDARIADNGGQQPIDQPIYEKGPAAYFSTLPIKAMVQGIQQQGIPVSVSQTAGTFVCNHLMYGMLHYITEQALPIRGGFIHIPYSPEQAAKFPGAASMSISVVVDALKLAIMAAIKHTQDIMVTGGTTH